MAANNPDPGKVVDGKPKTTIQIYRFAQGALLLLAIATIAVGWAGNRLAVLIITVVFVFGMMVALLGFHRMATAKNTYYAKLGMVLITLVLVAVLALFATILLYVGTGYPPWLDRIFGIKVLVQVPNAHVNKKAVKANSIDLVVAPYPNPNADIKIDVFVQGKSAPVFRLDKINTIGQDVVVDGLKPATSYQLRLVATDSFRESSPLIIAQATDAVKRPFPLRGHREVIATYSGPLTPKLVPNGNGTVIIKEADGTWTFTGLVHGGEIDGVGPMSFAPAPDAPACDRQALESFGSCSSVCSRVKFKNGVLVSADCDLILSEAAWKERKKTMSADATGVYVGGLAASESDPEVMIGPYGLVYDGKGKLKAGKITLSGNWKNGSLSGNGKMELATGEIRVGTFDAGILREGTVYSKPIPLSESTASFDVKDFGPVGAAAWFGPKSFRFGRTLKFSPISNLGSGFGGEYEEGKFVLTQYGANGLPKAKFYPVTKPSDTDCPIHESFGMNIDTSAWRKEGWKIWDINHLSQESNDIAEWEETLELSPADIHVSAFRDPDQAADIRFWLGNNFDAKQALSIDGRVVATNTIYAAPQKRAGLTLASLCFAKQVENMTNDKVKNLDGFCPVIAIFLGRTYYCSPKLNYESQSLWHSEKSVGEWQVTENRSGAVPASLRADPRSS